MKKVRVLSSIKYRIILTLIVIISVPIIIFSTVQINTGKNNIIEQTKKEMQYQMNVLDKVLSEYILSLEENLNYLQARIEINSKVDEGQSEYIDDILKSTMDDLSNNIDSVEYIYLVLEDGRIYSDSKVNFPEGYNPLERPFYKDAIKANGKSVLTSAYKWEDKNVITLSKSIKYKNNVDGVLGIDINISKLDKLSEDARYSDYANVLIIDSTGNIISNRNSKSKDIQNIKDIDLQMYNINEIDKYKGINKAIDNEYIMDYQKSELEGLNIIRLVDSGYIKNQFNSSTSKIVFVSLSTIILILILLVILCNKAWEPVKYIIEISQNIKNGNYNIKKLYNKENEFGLIEDSLYSMSNQVKKVQSKLEILAYRDTLLKINNKNKFINKMNAILNQKNRYGSILIIDINNFKLFNEKFGYSNGDTFLKKITQYFSSIVDDENLFRYGDDEFIILLEESSSNDAIYISNKIHDRFKNNWSINDINYTIKSTILITDYNSNVNDLDYILRSFEYGMKEAKYKNKKTNYFDSKETNIKRKKRIKEILDVAIKNDKLKIYYQPIMNIENNRYHKMEALIRLVDEDLGIISPIEFISIAEETGQIYDIGLYTLEKSCKKVIELDDENKHIEAISVNISVVQFMNENFVQDVINTIDRYSVGYDRLIFEITENIFMHSYNKVVSIMKTLSDRGIRFAIDDFGTGFSSLSYILNLPINIIKIDKSFIDDIICSKKNKDIVELIVSMSEKLEMDIIVEGVESKEQIDILENLGCKSIQGYYFSKPIDNDEINNLLDIT